MHWLPASAFTQTDLNKLFGQSKSKTASNNPKRIFYYVDDMGKRIGGYPVYVVDLKPGRKNPGPIDAARKVVHRVLQQRSMDHLQGGRASKSKSKKPRKRKRIPKSVQNAVNRAIKQNFMCDCDVVCENSECKELSTERGQEYLDSYFDDPSHLFTDGLTVCIRENGKKSLRRYNGCYRRLTNPSNDCIRMGLRKEPVVSYVDSIRVR